MKIVFGFVNFYKVFGDCEVRKYPMIFGNFLEFQDIVNLNQRKAASASASAASTKAAEQPPTNTGQKVRPLVRYEKFLFTKERALYCRVD